MLVSPQARDIVGSYIYEKMGRSGLIITIQDFKHEMPLKAFADQIGAPILGVSAYPIFMINNFEYSFRFSFEIFWLSKICDTNLPKKRM